MSGQIFLYISGGRTLWVPRHTPTAGETKPVCMLNFATPMELSRSFYLFDYPVQVVENAQMAALHPNAKTPNEILAAVNDFRRLCAEDQSFLLQRCYNPQQQQQQPQQQQQQSRPPQQQQQVQLSPQPQTNNYQGSYAQAMPSSSQSGSGGGAPMDNSALLAQLLQQQLQQQQQQQQAPIMGELNSGSFPDLNSGANTYSGSFDDNSNSGGGSAGDYYGGRSRGGRNGGMGYNNNMPYSPDMMQQQQQQANPMMMMGANMGYSSGNAGYGMNPMMMMGGNSMGYQRAGGRGGRRGGQMYGNYGNPMMMQQPNPMMMMMGGNAGMGRRGGMNAADAMARMAPGTRLEAEPIQIDVEVPEEIKNVYMNRAQPLVIATMPGPHLTVWLREHPIPTDTQDKKFVFGKNGVILMLKAAFEEVKNSKPVELFPKQICTHFFIYGYCARQNCLHEHHTERQLRELIAARHVQLKAMTKAQRHELIDEIEKKNKAGLEAVEALRAEREKQRALMAADRDARRQQRQPRDRSASAYGQQQQQQPLQPPINPSQDIGSDDEDDNNNEAAQHDNAVQPTSTEADAEKEVVDTQPSSEALAKLGITDSDEDGENEASSSPSSSSKNSSRSASASPSASSSGANDAVAQKEPEPEPEPEAKVEATQEAKEADGEEAKESAPAKRQRSATPKKTTKRAKK